MSWKKTLGILGGFIMLLGMPIYLVSNGMMDTYQEWIDKNPQTGFHKWLELRICGGVCFKTLRPDRSAVAYRKYLEYYPDDAENRPFALFRYAESLEEDNKNAQAVEMYAAFIETYPDDPRVKDATSAINRILYVKPK